MAGRYDVQIHSTLGVAGLSGGFTSVATERKISGIEKSLSSVDGYLTVVLTSEEGLFVGVSGADAVKFEGVPATSYVVDSPYQITAVVPKISEGFYTVSVE